MPIPPFSTTDNVLPPYVGINPGQHSDLMSPYKVGVPEVVSRFSTSPERKAILAGWLQHRQAIRAIGLRRGFQWLDGSFMEDRGVPPGDIDVVTFFHRPTDHRTNTLFHPFWNTHYHALFDRNTVRVAYHVDLFPVDLNGSPEAIVSISRYLLQLFSHQRVTGVWKGMLEVRLEDNAEDASLLAGLTVPAAVVGP